MLHCFFVCFDGALVMHRMPDRVTVIPAPIRRASLCVIPQAEVGAEGFWESAAPGDVV
jgi:hypothetical protein